MKLMNKLKITNLNVLFAISFKNPSTCALIYIPQNYRYIEINIKRDKKREVVSFMHTMQYTSCSLSDVISIDGNTDGLRFLSLFPRLFTPAKR